jgi:2-polyprenyl-3-methyl-5-hydroxy-6-metoxy-1,4-benzoquinol methylase
MKEPCGVINKPFQDKNSPYYNIDKRTIYETIPEGPHKVLDIGCATGKLGLKLKTQGKASELFGIELFAPAADEARKHYEKVYTGDVETLDLDFRSYFDYVLCGDVLEHLRDPWAIVARIRGWLKVGGHLVTSIPNIRYWSILRDLVAFGRWSYEDAGILDRTHLRFFTKKTVAEMIRGAGFNLCSSRMIIPGWKKQLARRMTLGLFDEFLGAQILTVARRDS